MPIHANNKGKMILIRVHFIYVYVFSADTDLLPLHVGMYISPGWKIQKMVKKSWLSVKKMWIWCEKYQKKFGLNWRFPWRAPAKTCSLVFGSAICPLHVICKAICGPKKFHPVCLTFDPLGLQMTTIAQNDQNLLRIKIFGLKKFFNWKWINFGPIYSCPKLKLKCLGLLLSVTKSQKWAKSSVFMSIPIF